MNRIRGLQSFEKLPECHQVTMVALLLAAFASASAVGPHHWYCTTIITSENPPFIDSWIWNVKNSTNISSVISSKAISLEPRFQICYYALAAASIANNKQQFWSFGGHGRQRSPPAPTRNNFWPGCWPRYNTWYDIESLLKNGFS